jgi:hypothetical protein
MTLASSVPLKVPDEGGMAGPDNTMGVWRLSSLNSAAVAASSMLSYSQFSACYALASTVMTPVGPSILSLR